MASPQDVGGRVYAQAKGVDTFDYTPYQPLANIVDKIVVNNISSADIISISVNEKVLWRIPYNTYSLNYVLDDSRAVGGLGFNIFDWFYKTFGYQLTLPLAQSFTLNIKSESGATFDVYLEAMEVLSGVVTRQMINDPRSDHYILPVFGYINAAVTNNGPIDVDTFIAPNYIPEVFLPTKQPGGYVTKLLALFSDAFSDNAYAAPTDHISRVEALRITKNGQPMYTRTNGGIPNLAVDKTAGGGGLSNVGLLQRYPAFGVSCDYSRAILTPPLEFMQGDTIEFGYLFSGDYGAGGVYLNMLLCGILDVMYANQ